MKNIFQTLKNASLHFLEKVKEALPHPPPQEQSKTEKSTQTPLEHAHTAFSDRGYRPKLQQFKIFVDAAFHSSSRKSAVGLYLENLNVGLALPIRTQTSTEAEGVGIWFALALARRLNITPTVICDNYTVAQAIDEEKPTTGRWRLNEPWHVPLFSTYLIHKAREEKEKVHGTIRWQDRETTHIPHNLAAIGIKGQGFFFFFGKENPLDIEQKLEQYLQTHDAHERTIIRQDYHAHIFDLPQQGLAWQDWHTELHLDRIAHHMKNFFQKK